MYTASIFLFRRDLRLFDNAGLHQALQRSNTVWPIFCFDPQQVEEHPYRSLPALRFMLESLADLQLQLVEAGGRLLLFRGQPQDLLPQLLTSRLPLLPLTDLLLRSPGTLLQTR